MGAAQPTSRGERRVIYHPASPADPYLAVVFNARGEVVTATPTPTWREAEKALKGIAQRDGELAAQR